MTKSLKFQPAGAINLVETSIETQIEGGGRKTSYCITKTDLSVDDWRTIKKTG